MHPPTKASGGAAPPQQAQPVPDDASVSGCLCLRLLIQHFVIQHFLSHYYLLQVEAEDHRAATLPVLHRRLRRDLLLGALLYIVYGGYTGRHSLASSYHAPNPRTTQQAHYFAPPRAWLGLTAAWPPLQYVPGCAGGDARVLFVGDCMNLALISLFAHFYWRSYLRAAPNPVTKRE